MLAGDSRDIRDDRPAVLEHRLAILPADLDGSILPPAGCAESVARRRQRGERGRSIASTSTSRRPRTRPSRWPPRMSAGSLHRALHADTRTASRSRARPTASTASRDRRMFRLAYRRFGDGHEGAGRQRDRLPPAASPASAGSRSTTLTAGHADVRPAEHLPARHDLALDGQRGDGPGRQPGPRLQRLERGDRARRSVMPDGSRATRSTRWPRVRPPSSPAPAARPAPATAGATTAT